MTDTEVPNSEPTAGRLFSLTLVPFEFEDERKENWCTHRFATFTIDRKARSVRCKKCGAEVDPYVAIDAIAHCWDRWESSRQHCEAKAKAAEERLADLERQERNARTRVDRLRDKVLEALPAEFAEAIAVLSNRYPYSRAWEQRRKALLERVTGTGAPQPQDNVQP